MKSNPGKVTVASAGVGSAAHISWELFKSMTKVDALHVPYRGEGPSFPDLLGGQVQMMLPTISPTIQHIQSGGLRALAVTSAQRVRVLPDVPVLADFLPGFDFSIYAGLAAPRGTPAAIIEKLSGEVRAALNDQGIRQRIEDLGNTILPLSSAEFGKLIALETSTVGQLIRAAGIKAQ